MPRQDLNKVMCERGRIGGGRKPKGLKKADSKVKKGVSIQPVRGESLSPFPHKEGMLRNYNSWDNRKQFNENLNALWGLLRKSVGMKWDVVYGMICLAFDKRKVINEHILIHLFQNVQVHAFMQGKKVFYLDERAYFGERNKPIEDSSADYYVHPNTGILMAINRKNAKRIFAQRLAERKKEEAKHLRLLATFENKETGKGSRYAIKIKDVWYEISVVKTPAPTKHRRLNSKGEIEYYTRHPIVETVSIHGAELVPQELQGVNGYYVCRKEQLNKKRIKDLKLQ